MNGENDSKDLAPANPEMAAIIERYQSDPDRQNYTFQEWFLLMDGRLTLAAETIKAQAERMLAQVEAQRKALHWRYGPDFRTRVEADLQSHKGKRSIDYLTGRAGFRKTPAKLVVTNAKELTDWAAVNCPDAVRMEPKLHVTPVRKMIESTGEEPPGCRYIPAQDRFYPTVYPPQIEEGESDGSEV